MTSAFFSKDMMDTASAMLKFDEINAMIFSVKSSDIGSSVVLKNYALLSPIKDGKLKYRYHKGSGFSVQR